MAVLTSIYGATLDTLAKIKTYVGGDEHVNKLPVHDPTRDIDADVYNLVKAGLAEVANRTRKGNLVCYEFYVFDATANTTAPLRPSPDTGRFTVAAPFDGSVVALVATCENARTAGSATMTWQIGGTNQTLSVTIDATNTQYVRAVQLPGVETFSALDLLGVEAARDALWAAGTTPSIWAELYVSFGEEESGI